MKIDGRPPSLVPQPQSARDAATGRDGAVRKSRGGAEDTVELSPLARTLARLRSEVGDPEAIDETRVAELRAAIADGTYQPAPRDVAQALLRELAANRRG